MKKMNNKGFSLVELIIVIAIMAVLMGVLAPQFLKYVESSRVQKDESMVGEVENAVKIACSIEEVYNELGASNTISLTDGSALSVAGTSGTALADELKLSVPDVCDPNTVDFTSKKYDSATVTITVTIDTTNGTVAVSNDLASAGAGSGT